MTHQTNAPDEDELKLTSLDDGHDVQPTAPMLPLTTKDAPRSSGPIVYLDGLRGLAAFLVYLHHHISSYYGDFGPMAERYGYNGEYYFSALPFVRVFFTGGSASVMIFFVLSGYVLSRGPLRQIGEGHSPLKSLLSAAIRRPIRLFLPPAIVSVFCALALHTPFSPLKDGPPVHDNIFLELYNWAYELGQTFNPFIEHGPWIQWFTYNPPVWTMAYEFNGSILIFVSVALISRVPSAKVRALAFIIGGYILSFKAHWAMVCFMLGAALAQNDLAGLDKPFLSRLPDRTRSIMFNAMFFIGWYMLSIVAVNGTEQPGSWQFVKPFVPSWYYDHPWLPANMIGAFMLIYAVSRLPWIQRGLNSLKQLGRLSFMLYLTHVPWLWIVGSRVYRFLGATVENDGPTSVFDNILHIPDIGIHGMTTRFLVAQLIILPTNLALSEFVTVWVDDPCVTASRTFANKFLKLFGR